MNDWKKDEALPTTIVVFGASGDLTQRKLVPALYNLHRKRRLPSKINVVGFSRSPFSDEAFRQHLEEGVRKYSKNSYDAQDWAAFAPSLHYFSGNLSESEDFARLKSYLRALENGPSHHLFYMATSPQFFDQAIANLGRHDMDEQTEAACRVVVEKPFGRDITSAQGLNHSIHQVFDEKQIYRIDHYLGKETAQNILFFRFANTIMEPVWNRNYVDNIQISVAESVDVGHRAEYYDRSGVLRDMFQNHLLQLYTLVAMEPPASFNADHLRNEKVKVLSATRPIALDDVVIGQYQGYLETPGVAPGSCTPTYAALKLYLDNWRWQGVPFYLRSGKKLAQKVTEIMVEFKCPPDIMFNRSYGADFSPNLLSICIDPEEGIHLRFEAKKPDSTEETCSVDMEFQYRDYFSGGALPEAYERLLLDALKGDASLFARNDEIELAWTLMDPVIAETEKPDRQQLAAYPQDGWGPAEAVRLLERDGRGWQMGCASE